MDTVGILDVKKIDEVLSSELGYEVPSEVEKHIAHVETLLWLQRCHELLENVVIKTE